MRYIRISISLFLLLFTTSVFSLTEADCRGRIITSMENAKGLGGSQADEERWGKIAANDCLKELSTKGNANSSLPLSNGSFDASAFLIPAVILSLLGYFVAWPLISGFLDSSKKIPSSEEIPSPEGNKPQPSATTEVENKRKQTLELRREIREKIGRMTVEEICLYTKSTRRSTLTWLTSNGYTCVDYDGAKRREDVLSKTSK